MLFRSKNDIIHKEFKDLWIDLWGKNISNKYKQEEKVAYEKYLVLKNGIVTNDEEYNLYTLLNSSTTNWKEQEWGFPKGRRNFQEKDNITAMREFEEETGIHAHSIKMIYNILPFEEIFTGSNLKSYKHKYFLAQCMNNYKNPVSLDNYEKSEVSKIEWMSYVDCMNSIRNYNLEKKIILMKVYNTLNYCKLMFS